GESLGLVNPKKPQNAAESEVFMKFSKLPAQAIAGMALISIVLTLTARAGSGGCFIYLKKKERHVVSNGSTYSSAASGSHSFSHDGSSQVATAAADGYGAMAYAGSYSGKRSESSTFSNS